jgi:hypothetical protein
LAWCRACSPDQTLRDLTLEEDTKGQKVDILLGPKQDLISPWLPAAAIAPMPWEVRGNEADMPRQ